MQSLDDDRLVKLNVGGKRFETRAGTLQASGYFRNIFLSEKWKKWPEEKPLFVDRCPKRFRHVLNLLREENYDFPVNCLSELLFFDVRWEKTQNFAPELKSKQDLSAGGVVLWKNGKMLRIGYQLYERSEILAVQIKCFENTTCRYLSVYVCSQDATTSQRAVKCAIENFITADKTQEREIIENIGSLLASGSPIRGLRQKLIEQSFDYLKVQYWFYYPDRVPIQACGGRMARECVVLDEMEIPDAEWFAQYCFL